MRIKTPQFKIPQVDSFDNKEEIAFKTYHMYLKSISALLYDIRLDAEDYLSTITQNPKFGKIQTKKNVDYEKISRILRNAWYTEFQLRNLSLSYEFASYSLQWALVYSYYNCYLLIRSYFVSQDRMVDAKHRTTLRQFSYDLKERASLFQHPWNILCDGNPKDNNFINKSSSYKFHHQLSYSAIDNPIDVVSTFIKTTREKEIIRKIQEFKSQNNFDRIPTNEKKKIINDTAPTSIYDCLYRLRIKANYEDVDIFFIKHINIIISKEFHESLQNIVWMNSLLLETLISKYLSFKQYSSIIEKYKIDLSKISPESNNLLAFERWNLILNRIK